MSNDEYMNLWELSDDDLAAEMGRAGNKYNHPGLTQRPVFKNDIIMINEALRRLLLKTASKPDQKPKGGD